MYTQSGSLAAVAAVCCSCRTSHIAGLFSHIAGLSQLLQQSVAAVAPVI